ncbi:MAG: glutathione S-transferase family protein [Acidobacteriota bacterium]
MSDPLRVHGFETSNNMKVRVALGYKGLPYEFLEVDPKDRTTIHGLTGQHFTPVLEHGDRRIFDSAAILRYLDANFLDTPRLFGSDYHEQRAIESWEGFARTELAAPMMEVVLTRVRGEEVSDETLTRCGAEFAEAGSELVERLKGHDWLVGDDLTAADVTAAPVIFRVREGKVLPWDGSLDALAAWVDRVMGHDGKGRL